MFTEIQESEYLYEGLEDEVLKQRVKLALKWNIHKAILYKRCYYLFACIAIVAPLLVSVLHSLDNDIFIQMKLQTYSVILTTLTTVSSSVISLYHFQERWKEHRETAEKLKTELAKYHMKIGVYTKKDVRILSTNIEAIIAEDNKQRMKLITAKNTSAQLPQVKQDSTSSKK